MASALSFASLAYRLRDTVSGNGDRVGRFYALAAIATASIVPYTLTVMRSINGTLHDKVNETKSLSLDEVLTEVGVTRGESTKQLVDHWGVLNFGRGLLPLVGSILGCWAALS